MIHFQCGHCGARIKVPETQVGRQGRCPRCQQKITVPPGPVDQAPAPGPAAQQEDPRDRQSRPRKLALDAALLDVPAKGGISRDPLGPYPGAPAPAADVPESTERTAAAEVEPAAGSRLPWLVDVFLYPFNLAGILHLVSLWLLINLLCPAVMQYLGLGTEFVPVVYTLPVAYVVYYLAECIRAGAGGARRAPDFWMSPGDSSRWDCLAQFVLVVGCFAVCFWPISVYYIVRERADWIYWLLLFGGAFFLPMVLLAVVWFDSYSGLNPILILGSMSRTLVPYSAIVLLLGAEALLFVKMGLNTYGFYRPPPLPFVLRLVQLYLLFVAAGLLGRFYQRYKERLKWDL